MVHLPRKSCASLQRLVDIHGHHASDRAGHELDARVTICHVYCAQQCQTVDAGEHDPDRYVGHSSGRGWNTTDSLQMS